MKKPTNLAAGILVSLACCALNSPTFLSAAELGSVRVNLQNVPLELLLGKLAEAAGCEIQFEVQPRGTASVVCQQAITKEEASSLLDGVLARNGYTALRKGNTLTVVNFDAAKSRAVADARTSSVIVSASRSVIDQIGSVVHQLDSTPAHRQSIGVYQLKNARPQEVVKALQTLFQKNTASGTGNTSTQTDPLDIRANSQTQATGTGSRTAARGGGGGGQSGSFGGSQGGAAAGGP